MGKETNKVTDKIESGSEASYRLSTMIPFDVFMEFVRFCKKNTITGTQKWDFGNGLRLLLMKAEYADKLEEFNSRLTKLEGGQNNG